MIRWVVKSGGWGSAFCNILPHFSHYHLGPRKFLPVPGPSLESAIHTPVSVAVVGWMLLILHFCAWRGTVSGTLCLFSGDVFRRGQKIAPPLPTRHLLVSVSLELIASSATVFSFFFVPLRKKKNVECREASTRLSDKLKLIFYKERQKEANTHRRSGRETERERRKVFAFLFPHRI